MTPPAASYVVGEIDYDDEELMIEEEEEEGEDIEEVNNAEYNVFGLPGSELPPGLFTNSLFSHFSW